MQTSTHRFCVESLCPCNKYPTTRSIGISYLLTTSHAASTLGYSALNPPRDHLGCHFHLLSPSVQYGHLPYPGTIIHEFPYTVSPDCYCQPRTNQRIHMTGDKHRLSGLRDTVCQGIATVPRTRTAPSRTKWLPMSELILRRTDINIGM